MDLLSFGLKNIGTIQSVLNGIGMFKQFMNPNQNYFEQPSLYNQNPYQYQQSPWGHQNRPYGNINHPYSMYQNRPNGYINPSPWLYQNRPYQKFNQYSSYNYQPQYGFRPFK